jgi:hypothetical protein
MDSPKRRKMMQSSDLPKRPGSKSKEELVGRDSFMMDFENSCLADWVGDFPKGNRRHLDKDWAAFMQTQVFPNHSDVDWSEYCLWVEAGYGDEWFQDINDHD